MVAQAGFYGIGSFVARNCAGKEFTIVEWRSFEVWKSTESLCKSVVVNSLRTAAQDLVTRVKKGKYIIHLAGVNFTVTSDDPNAP
jgi:hypothetical protein